MTFAAIIQARMGSTRLPGKVLADIAGVPMLLHVVARARAARTLDRVVVATSTSAADDRISEFCASSGIDCVRGSEDDVLDRYVSAAREVGAHAVVRLTADCPLLDPRVIDDVTRVFLAGGFDYVSNVDPPTFPDGLDTEVVRVDALERAWREARLRSEREHVTPYIRGHPEVYRIHNVRNDRDLSHLRLTVDEPKDLALIRALCERLGPGLFGMEAVVKLLEDEPSVGALNAGIRRNEGYEKSLRADARLAKPGDTQ